MKNIDTYIIILTVGFISCIGLLLVNEYIYAETHSYDRIVTGTVFDRSIGVHDAKSTYITVPNGTVVSHDPIHYKYLPGEELLVCVRYMNESGHPYRVC